MDQAASLSLSRFTAAVQTAVKAAVEKHPKFKIDASSGVTISYLIRGIPVPEQILATVSLQEMRAFADELASHISAPEGIKAAAVTATPSGGAIYSVGKHLIVGIPAVQNIQLFEK